MSLNIEQEPNEVQEVPVQTPSAHQPKKTLTSSLALLIILLVATAVGAGFWFYAVRVKQPEVISPDQTIAELRVENAINEKVAEKESELPYGYEIKDGGVYYQGELIETADVDTFRFFAEVELIYVGLDKLVADKKNLFHGEDIVEGDFDLLTLTQMEDQSVYFKDYTGVYIYDNVITPKMTKIPEADPNTFVLGGACSEVRTDVEYFSKDANSVFCGKNKLSDVDPETWERVGTKCIDYGSRVSCFVYSKDKNNVYRAGSIVKGADPATFELPTGLNEEQACLAVGTKILMADGSYKNIEDIVVGDIVTSYNPATGEYLEAEVDQFIERKDPLVIINDTLRAAPDEPVYLHDGTIVLAMNLKVGDHLLNEEGEGVEVKTIEYNAKIVDTYDFTLRGADTFFADGYLVGTPDL